MSTTTDSIVPGCSGKSYVVEDGFIVATICFVIRSGQVLLGLKSTKHKFGAGTWNAPGGKMEASRDLTVRDCAKRELADETGIEGLSFREIGVLFSEHPPLRMKVHLFIVEQFRGIPHPTDELTQVEWFSVSAIPWTRIWPDMQVWFPRVLVNEPFTAFAKYDEQGGFKKCDLVKGTVIQSFREAFVGEWLVSE